MKQRFSAIVRTSRSKKNCILFCLFFSAQTLFAQSASYLVETEVFQFRGGWLKKKVDWPWAIPCCAFWVVNMALQMR